MPYKDPAKQRECGRRWDRKNALRRAEYQSENLPRIAKREKLKRYAAYGLTEAVFEALLAGQGFVCAICKTAEWGGVSGQPCVDHDHATGKVRGILCNACNIVLGIFRDSPQRLHAAADYLERV